MNPGRSFGPTVLSGAWDQGIVYFLAPTLRALIAVFAMWLIYGFSENSEKASADGN